MIYKISDLTVETVSTPEGNFIQISKGGKVVDMEEIQGGSLELSPEFLNYLSSRY
jgi:hypothetical protein